MIELFSYQFVWVALFVSFLVSICSGVIGSMIVANKNVFVAGGVAHSAFGGVGLALFCGFSTMLGALCFGVAMAIFLAYAFLYQRERLDAYVGASWAFGMAIGVIFIDLSPGYNSDISSYLFGSILAVGTDEMIAMAAFDIFLIIFVRLYYYEILGLFYDSEFCQTKGLNVNVWISAVYECSWAYSCFGDFINPCIYCQSLFPLAWLYDVYLVAYFTYFYVGWVFYRLLF